MSAQPKFSTSRPHTRRAEDQIDTPGYRGPERRASLWLTEEQIEHIAGIAADKAAEKSADLAVKKLTDDAYKAIGKGVVNKFLVIVGVLTAAAYLYAQQKGWVK